MQRMLTEKAMADAVGKMDMMKGDKPTTEELLEIIIPLIPEPVKGDKGDKGDKGADSTVAGPQGQRGPQGESIVGPQGLRGEVGPQGKDGSPDTAPQVRDKLESLKKGEKLTIYAIEDLADLLEELKKWRGEVGTFMSLGGGGGFTSPVYNFVDDETPTGTLNGVNTDFSVRGIPYPGSLKVYRNGQRLKVTKDYTLSSHGKTITFLTAPESDEELLCDYRTN